MSVLLRIGRMGLMTLMALVLCTNALPGRAQPLPALYQQALQTDPNVQAARAATRAARFKTGQAEAQRGPAVVARGDLGVNNSRDSLALPERSNARTYQVGLQVQQTVYSRADALGVDQAQAQVALSLRQETAAESELRWRLVQAWVDLLAARATATVQTQARSTLASQLDAVQAALRAGTATLVDLHETKARLDLALTQERAALADLRARQAAVDAVVGTDNVVLRPLPLVSTIATAPTGDVADWIAAARNSADAVLQASASVDLARWEARRARAGFGPTVSLNASVSAGGQQQAARVGGDSGGDSGVLQRHGKSHNASLGLTLSLPIDANAAIDQREKEALALEDRARANLDAARRQAAASAEQAWLSLQSLQQQILGTEAAERSSTQSVEATARGLAAGVRLRLDVLTAQTQLFAIRSNLVRLRHEAALSWLRLQQLSGRLSLDGL